MASKKPSEILSSVQEDGRSDKTLITLWLESLDPDSQKRWWEFLDAFESMPEVTTPDLMKAVRSDEILGESFPRISSNRLKKWINAKKEEREK